MHSPSPRRHLQSTAIQTLQLPHWSNDDQHLEKFYPGNAAGHIASSFSNGRGSRAEQTPSTGTYAPRFVDEPSNKKHSNKNPPTFVSFPGRPRKTHEPPFRGQSGFSTRLIWRLPEPDPDRERAVVTLLQRGPESKFRVTIRGSNAKKSMEILGRPRHGKRLDVTAAFQTNA